MSQPLRFVNPKRKRRRSRVRRRRNPLLASVVNPRRVRRRRNGMNPARRSYRIRRRRNPSIAGFTSSFMNAIRTALPVVVGIYGSRYLTRAALKDKDRGAYGYGANAIAALLMAGGARLAGRGQDAGLVAAGGFSALILRLLTDVAPKLAAPAGLSDYIQGGRPGLRGLGIPELDLDDWGYTDGGLNDYIQGARPGLQDGGLGRINLCSWGGWTSVDQIQSDPRLSDRSKAIASGLFEASCGGY